MFSICSDVWINVLEKKITDISVNHIESPLVVNPTTSYQSMEKSFSSGALNGAVSSGAGTA